MKESWNRYKSVISYLFFGVCTTAVNIIVYYLCARMLKMGTAGSTAAAWAAAVLFAYITNKLFVFESRSFEKSLMIRELASFFTCRLLTGVLDLAVMYICVERFGWNDMIMKVISNALVIVINYVASKLLIFKKSVEDQNCE